jgi:ribosomal protein S18 acetylase RimI-like enzyme
MTDARPTIAVREFHDGDGDDLRELWAVAGFRLHGDDDEGLARFAARNPGLFLVATAPGGAIVASAMGAWDGRRGWIYHVAVAPTHRRTGVATLLVERVETQLGELGAVRVNVLIRDGNDRGRAFWSAAGYEISGSRQYGKDLQPGQAPDRGP